MAAMATVSYREAERSDIAAMSRIRAAEWGTEPYWTDRITAYLDGTHNPQKALPPRVMYVAEQEGSLIGFIAGHLTERFHCDGELEWINVVPESRGSGAASEMLRLLTVWFVERNAMRICVNCDTGNAAAFHFYTQHGAKPMKPHWLIWDDIGIVLSQKL